MGAIFGILGLVCALAAFVCWIWLIVVIFQDGGVLWGIGSIIFGLVGLIYVAMNWGDRVKKPFLLTLGATVAMYACFFIGGASAPGP